MLLSGHLSKCLSCANKIVGTQTLVGLLQYLVPKVVCESKIVAKSKDWYFVTKIVLTYCEKKNVLVIEKNF